MQRSDIPYSQDLVLAGGGHAHAVFLRMWAMDPLPGIRLTLINPEPVAPYTGMLPGVVAGHYASEEAEIELWRLAGQAGAAMVLDEVTGLDADNNLIQLKSRPPLTYDVLSLNIGITTPRVVENGQAHVHPVKPMSSFLTDWQAYLDERRETEEVRIAIIGGGPGGVELALAMRHRLSAHRSVQITLIEREREILSDFHAGLRRSLRRELDRAGIDVRTQATVHEAHPDHLHLSSGETIASDFTVSAAGAEPASWLKDSGLGLNDAGFVRVDRSWRSLTHGRVFASGDIAHLEASPRPKAGVYAVRAGAHLHTNLKAALRGDPPKRFGLQTDYMKMIGLGDERAIAERGGFTFSGGWVWRWKQWIDQRFMDRYNRIQIMDMMTESLKEAPPLCAGCGSKLPRQALDEALSALASSSRDDVLTGPGDDAAVLKQADGRVQVLTTDHFRAFTEDPYVLGQIAAHHALGDVYAMGADPQSLMASVTLPEMIPSLQARTLRALMSGIQVVADESGAAIIGGHSSQGAEMSVGITATGLADEKRVVRQSGLNAGDVLVLTKPLGTGIMLAGEMQGLASSRDLAEAYQSMLTSHRPAAEVLSRVATAMTDVTGFGLAGHLLAMLESSGVSAEINLSGLPVIRGTIDLIERGIQSSLYADNQESLDRMTASETVISEPRFKLIFDPQTSGGLLAGIPESDLKSAIKECSKANQALFVIGKCIKTTTGPETLSVLA